MEHTTSQLMKALCLGKLQNPKLEPTSKAYKHQHMILVDLLHQALLRYMLRWVGKLNHMTETLENLMQHLDMLEVCFLLSLHFLPFSWRNMDNIVINSLLDRELLPSLMVSNTLKKTLASLPTSNIQSMIGSDCCVTVLLSGKHAKKYKKQEIRSVS